MGVHIESGYHWWEAPRYGRKKEKGNKWIKAEVVANPWTTVKYTCKQLKVVATMPYELKYRSKSMGDVEMTHNGVWKGLNTVNYHCQTELVANHDQTYWWNFKKWD